MKRIVALGLCLVVLHASQPDRQREAQANVMLGVIVLAAAAIAGGVVIYVMTRNPKPQEHTMILESKDPVTGVWTPLATNVITMDPEVFYQAFRVWCVSNRVADLFRVVEVPKIPGFQPQEKADAYASPILQP